jgi:hypothetical protein
MLTFPEYMLPNDVREQDRLGMYPITSMEASNPDRFFSDLQHHSFKIMLDGKLHLAPISSPRRVLDLATGTGIWAIEFGMSISFSKHIAF